MKLTGKYIWVDGDIVTPAPDSTVIVTDPEVKWHGKGRITVYDRPRQTVLGFGGAFTEAAAHNYALLPDAEKKKALELLFGENGLAYNFCRVTLGGCDFSLDGYRYASREDLADFSIEHDRKEIIPFIRDAIACSKRGITLFASPWSPPAFFKDTGELTRGKLREDAYEPYAMYFCRFLKAYRDEGIPISAVTVQNEPGLHRWEGCAWDDDSLIRFTGCLLDTFEKEGLDTKVLCWDYNRGGMFDHISRMYDSPVGKRVWGAGFHWYNGVHTGELDVTHDCYPDKVLVETEFCHGLGARMYDRYRLELMDVLNHHTNAVVEWNLMLDWQGGPYHNRDIGCNAPVIRNEENQVETRDIYRQTYLFSHFIRPGAKVLYTSSAFRQVMTLAVRNPDGKYLIYLCNNGSCDLTSTVCFGDTRWDTEVPMGCVVLFEAESE